MVSGNFQVRSLRERGLSLVVRLREGGSLAGPVLLMLRWSVHRGSLVPMASFLFDTCLIEERDAVVLVARSHLFSLHLAASEVVRPLCCCQVVTKSLFGSVTVKAVQIQSLNAYGAWEVVACLSSFRAVNRSLPDFICYSELALSTC